MEVGLYFIYVFRYLHIALSTGSNQRDLTQLQRAITAQHVNNKNKQKNIN